MNPHSEPWLTQDMIKALDSIRRLDKDGYFYEMDCAWDDSDLKWQECLQYFKQFQSGCSAFVTHTPQGGALTCRNYDYRHHRHNQAEEPTTGINVLLHCAPKGKYRSLCMADAFWMDSSRFFDGTLDDGKTDLSLLAFLPFVCMDGMNEKGLTVSILAQAIQKGESATAQNDPQKPVLTHTVLMREMLDSCANLEEALFLTSSVNIVSVNGSDYRLFVTDQSGASAVLEWRYHQLKITRTNACTNFYVGFDDAQDRMHGELLWEKAVRLEGTSLPYRYGYGGGYQRFAAMVSQLEMYRVISSPVYRTQMKREQADIIIRSVIQGLTPDTTSLTQYSAIYDQKSLSLTLRLLPHYRKRYSFKLL